MGLRKTGHFARTALLLATVLTMLLLAGCSDDDDNIPVEILATWQLQEFILDGGTTTKVDDPAKYTVEFKNDGNAHVKADCNNCNGSYFVDGMNLSFGAMACTLAACPPGSFDAQFTGALSTVASYEIQNGALFLKYQGGELRMTPEPTLFQ